MSKITNNNRNSIGLIQRSNAYNSFKMYNNYRNPVQPTNNIYDGLKVANNYKNPTDGFETVGRYVWSTRIGGAGNDFQPFVIYGDNSVYVSGAYTSFLNVYDATTSTTTVAILPNNGGIDIFLVKYNSNGAFNWATHIGGASTESEPCITYGDHSVYITGNYNSQPLNIYNASGTVSTLPTSGSNDIFIVKYNNDGAFDWATHIGGTSSETNSYVTCGDNGVYVSGRYISNPLGIYDASSTSNTVSTLPNNGSGDVFIVKYNSNGIFNWATHIGGIGNEALPSITYGDNSVYVSGSYSSSPLNVYDTLSTSNTVATFFYNGSNDIFLVKYNNSGIFVWATHIGGVGADIYPSIIYGDNNVYVSGAYNSQPLNIYDTSSTSGTVATLSNSGGIDIFVVRYKSNGIFDWATRIGGAGSESEPSITYGDNSVYVSGTYNSQPLDIYDASATTTTVATLPNNGSSDVFVVKYSSKGIFDWATHIGGTSIEEEVSITYGGNSAYVSARYVQTLNIYDISSTSSVVATLPNDGNGDIFLVKYR